jgi:hypothetical protein
MQYAFLFSNFVWSSYGSPWLQLSAQGKLGVLAQQSCAAFSQTTFGRNHYRHDIELEGTAQYGIAVTKVRRGLADLSDPAMSELLVPMLIFLLCSSSQPQTGESQAHVVGLFALLQMCGPEKFQRRPLRDGFSSCRATLTTVGLLQKKRLFLEEDKWCHLPWASEPQSKSSQDHLVDILLKVPGFLQDQEELRSSLDTQNHHLLLEAASSQLRLLFKWRWAWEAANPQAVAEIDRSDFASCWLIPPEASRQLQFSSFTTAVEIALYNAVLLCYLGLFYSEMTVCETQSLIQRAATPSPQSSAPWTNPPLALPSLTAISLRIAAVEIVRSFEYQLLHIQQCPDTPALFWLFPLGLASKILSEDRSMSHWIQTMLDTSMVTRGYGRGDNAFGFGFYELPKVDERVGDFYPDVQIP